MVSSKGLLNKRGSIVEELIGKGDRYGKFLELE